MTVHRTTKSLTACVESVDHRLYLECFFSSPDIIDNPHTTAIKCHWTLQFRKDNISHSEQKHYNNRSTKQRRTFCQTLVQNLLGLQEHLTLSAAYEED
jgi:hypothetical protein